MNNLFEKIGDKKQDFIVEEFCQDQPEEIILYINCVRELSYEDKPDYVFLKKLFNIIMEENDWEQDYNFDWNI